MNSELRDWARTFFCSFVLMAGFVLFFADRRPVQAGDETNFRFELYETAGAGILVLDRTTGTLQAYRTADGGVPGPADWSRGVVKKTD